MILINPVREVEVVFKPFVFGMKGFHKWELVNKFSGKKRLVQDFRPNTILTSGRNTMSTEATWLTAVQVGNVNTPPVIGHTGLQGYVTGTTSLVGGSSTFSAQGSAPYYGWSQKTWRINDPLIANENIKEAGFGPDVSGNTLISRVLVEDQTGAPTVVTPLPDEYLDITYQMRYYPPLSDVTGTITLDSVLYNYIVRACEVTNGAAWGQYIGNAIGQLSISSTDWAAYSDVLGTLEQSPSGTVVACDNANQSNRTYSNNSYVQGVQCNTGPGGWNVVGGIRSIRAKTTAGWIQTQFGVDANALGNKIPKTTNKVMQMVWNIAWEEATLP